MKLIIKQDEDAQNPRTEFDNLGKIVHWHRRYDFGESIRGMALDDWLDGLPKGTVVLPISLLDHSGLHIWVGAEAHLCDPGGWDSGPVGFIYMTPDVVKKEFDGDKEKAKACLRQEIETYDQFLTGDVWGCIVEDDEGNHLDSCWGFYGRKYAEEEGARMLKHAEEHSFDPVI